MMSEKRLQKFHTYDVSLSGSGRSEANFQPIRSTTQIWEVWYHQYGISALICQMLFCVETSSGVAKIMLAVFSG